MGCRIKGYLFYLFKVGFALVKRFYFDSEMKMIWQKNIPVRITDRISMHRVFLKKESKIFVLSEEQFFADRVIKEMVEFIVLKWEVIFAHSSS